MTAPLRLICGIGVAAVIGFVLGELLCCSTDLRDLVGVALGRGHLVAMTHGIGFYEIDVDEETGGASDLVLAENLRRAARAETVAAVAIERELGLLRAEFGNENAFVEALDVSELSILSVRGRIAEELRAGQWLEKQLGGTTTENEADLRSFYERHLDLFRQPVRFRAAHLFLAAHADTPPDVVTAKESGIQALSARILRGGVFTELVAQNSEDEATKSRAGDLNYFSALRVPPEFFAEVAKLSPGQMGKPFQSHLGFHIIHLTEMKPARVLDFEEARPEIVLAIANARRASIMEGISGRLAQRSTELRDCVAARLP